MLFTTDEIGLINYRMCAPPALPERGRFVADRKTLLGPPIHRLVFPAGGRSGVAKFELVSCYGADDTLSLFGMRAPSLRIVIVLSASLTDHVPN
jgi:hypothetical protein